MRGNCETAKMGKDIKSRRDAVSGLKESLGAQDGLMPTRLEILRLIQRGIGIL